MPVAAGQRLGRLGHGVGDGDDAVEAGGVEQADEGGTVAADGDVAPRLPGPADAADERAQPGGVDEGDLRHVDEELGLGRQLAEGLTELAHGVGVQLPDGTADRVVVTLVELDVEHGLQDGADPSGSSGQLPSGAMPEVLVVSDSPNVREEVDRRRCPTPTSPCGSSTTAPTCWPRCTSTTPDLVVLDQQIGKMGGMAACLDLRLEEGAGRLPHVPVLMLLDRRADVFLARRSDAEGWVVKPLDPMRLGRAIPRCSPAAPTRTRPTARPPSPLH